MPAKKFIKKGKKAKGLGKSKSTTTYGKGGAKKYAPGGISPIGPMTEAQAAAAAANRPPMMRPDMSQFVDTTRGFNVPMPGKKLMPGNPSSGSGTPGKPTPAELDAIKKEQLMRELSGPPPTDRLGNPVDFIPANPFNKTLGGKVYNAKSMRQGGANIRNRRKNR